MTSESSSYRKKHEGVVRRDGTMFSVTKHQYKWTNRGGVLTLKEFPPLIQNKCKHRGRGWCPGLQNILEVDTNNLFTYLLIKSKTRLETGDKRMMKTSFVIGI